MMRNSVAMGVCLGWLVLAVGCASNRPMAMEKQFAQMVIGQTESGEVMEMLDSPGMLQTPGSVSVTNEQRWGTELGIVQFDQVKATVQRKDYFRHRSAQQVPFLTREQTCLMVETLVPPDVLNAPYENEVRKHMAILQYVLDAIKSDVRPFQEDQKTTSMMGLGRHGLEVGIAKLSLEPRQAYKIVEPKGFVFDHPTLGNCQLMLKAGDMEGVYSLVIRSGAWADPLTAW